MIRWLALTALLAIGAARAQEPTLALAGLTDNIDVRLLDEFQAESGIRVSYDGFDAAAGLEARLAGGKSGFDLAIVPGAALQRLILAGALQRLDRARLPSQALVSPLAAWQGVYDAGLAFGFPYQWHAQGIAYDVEKTRERLGDAPPVSWDLLFRPEILRKFTDCGVEWPDSPEELIPLALASLKANPASASLADARRALDLLLRLRPLASRLVASGSVHSLANGDACLAIVPAADAAAAAARAKAGKGGPHIGFFLPREGALALVEFFAAPKESGKALAAQRLVDFLSRPENAARTAARTGLASAIAAAKRQAPAEAGADAALYPDEAAMRRMFAAPGPDSAAQKALAKDWARLRAGK